MKKVVYSVTKKGRYEDTKYTGFGYITDTDLVITCVGKNNKPYIRIFEDCVTKCHAAIGKDGEFKGTYYEIREIEIEKKRFVRNERNRTYLLRMVQARRLNHEEKEIWKTKYISKNFKSSTEKIS